jgi:LysR family hydrogen peroxide-inducible transcriptional activator
MINLPTLKQLRHLVALAEHGHFGRAAEASHVTQSTLSASLKELEQVLGAQLVDRTKRRVTVTPLGQSVVAKARKLLQEAEDLVETARANRKPLSGPLQLGVIPTIGPFLLPRALPVLRRRHPGLKLYLTEDLTERLLEQLHSGKLDAALIALPYELPGLEQTVIGADPFTVALPEAHALARPRRSIRIGSTRSRCCSCAMVTACASMRSPPAGSRAAGRPTPSRRPASIRWCRWWRTGWASRSCPRSRSMPASSKARIS